MPGPSSTPGTQAEANAVAVDERTFIQQVALRTGIDPRVLAAWIASEGHPGDEGFNYLNLQSQTALSVGVKPSATLAADTAAFGSVQDGITATVREINALGLGHEAGKTPAAEIADISGSGWASSHYITPRGSNLIADVFRSRYGAGALGGPYSSDIGKVGAVKVPLSQSPIGQAAGAVVSALTLPERIFAFLTSWRFAELLGGAALVLLGFYLLGRQFGVSPPIPYAGAVSDALQVRQAERQGQQAAERHYARRAARMERTAELRRAEPSAQTDEIPF